jgi:hypothetical protein
MSAGKPGRSRSSQAITLYCEDSPAPGLNWVIRVEFRPLSRGFSVWEYLESAVDAESRWRKVGASSQPLNWRTACTFLAVHKELCVFGNYWDQAEIYGAPSWASVIARCLFIEDERACGDYRAIAELLLGFEEHDVRSILDQAGPLPRDPTADSPPLFYVALESVATYAKEVHLAGQSLDAIRASVGASHDDDLHQISILIEQAAEKDSRASFTPPDLAAGAKEAQKWRDFYRNMYSKECRACAGTGRLAAITAPWTGWPVASTAPTASTAVDAVCSCCNGIGRHAMYIKDDQLWPAGRCYD